MDFTAVFEALCVEFLRRPSVPLLLEMRSLLLTGNVRDNVPTDQTSLVQV